MQTAFIYEIVRTGEDALRIIATGLLIFNAALSMK
jgi:hypothetical protein